MGGAYSTYGGGKKCIQDFGGETGGKETTWKTTGVHGRIILKWIFKGSWAVVNAVINLRVQ
jgi:hypothetical protein